MKKRNLGQRGRGVSELALELGITFFDTADMYGPLINEQLVGKALAGKRDQVVLATKFGNVRGEDGSFKGVSGAPAYVKEACDASLKRLGVDCIDLYYQHRVDKKVPIEAVAAAHKAKPGQVALAWLLAQGEDIVPIPGTKRRVYLEENAAATELTLTADELALLSALPQAAGARYADLRSIDT